MGGSGRAWLKAVSRHLPGRTAVRHEHGKLMALPRLEPEISRIKVRTFLIELTLSGQQNIEVEYDDARHTHGVPPLFPSVQEYSIPFYERSCVSSPVWYVTNLDCFSSVCKSRYKPPMSSLQACALFTMSVCSLSRHWCLTDCLWTRFMAHKLCKDKRHVGLGKFYRSCFMCIT
jgi:hypothetical protein